ncbi:MAG: hypothetical protein NTV34_13645 [Proteobacteria bacterium]|nr:hypothetical protein [Pseudomonadota bacterium]
MTQTAVIMGGGFAGMACAQACSRHFDRVIMLDANEFSVNESASPQASHLHVLMQYGREILERFFPGIDQMMAERDCLEIDWAQDTLWISRHGAFPRYRSGILTRSASRRLLEETMRRFILKNQKIKIVDRFSVKDLIAEKGLVRGAVNRQGSVINGNFFVNALGRKNPFAFEARTDVSPLKVYYTSCLVRGFTCVDDYKQIYVQMRPSASPLGAVINPVEDGAHLLTLLTRAHAPFSDEGDVMRAVSSVLSEQFRMALAHVEIVSPIKKFCHAKGTRYVGRSKHHNMLTVGDAKCLFNPLYGQGMTIALMEAELIDRVLAKGMIIKQRHIARMDQLPWMIAASEDYVLLNKDHNQVGFLVYPFKIFFDLGLKIATKNRLVHRLLFEVLHMLRPVERGLFATLMERRRRP